VGGIGLSAALGRTTCDSAIGLPHAMPRRNSAMKRSFFMKSFTREHEKRAAMRLSSRA
jgi:hypothetical protein